MSYFDTLFNAEFEHLRPRTLSIDDLLTQERYLLISGDFFGIQKFIFEGLSTKNASKVLRAKSAYIQIFTKIAAYRICDALGIGVQQILSSSAGKFEILSPVLDEEKVAQVQWEVDDFFIHHFYGLSGMGITAVACDASEFREPKAYKALRERVAEAVEEKKFAKFGLPGRASVLAYDETIDNTSLCRICNMRKVTKQDRCDICDKFVRLGERLTKADTISIVREHPDISVLWDYGIVFKEAADAVEIFEIQKQSGNIYPHWPLSSYVYTGQHGEVSDFETLAKSASSDGRGIEALGVLKADVDKMGDFIRNTDVTDSFEHFDTFSKAIDAFFSVHVPEAMRETFPHTYTVFAGGDDLFVLGAWNELIDLARWLETEFKRFVKNARLSISMGMIVVKPSTPVNYVAEISEKALEAAKENDRDSITLFGETAKFGTYREQGKKFYEALKALDDIEELPTAFLYRLLELLRMSRNVNDDVMENALWRSKLNYTFRRNVFEKIQGSEKAEKAEALLGQCNEMFEKEQAIAKMVLSEFIYKRRKTA